MTGYTKLFGSIIASTIWCEDDQTRLVWITMLAMANQHGEVEASIPGLAKFAKVTVEATEAALEKLKAPDQYSRTKDFEGRRIEEIDGGWLILNHAKYRERASEDDRREKTRIRTQRYRARDAGVTLGDAPVTLGDDKQKHTQKQKHLEPTTTSRKPSIEQVREWAVMDGVEANEAERFFNHFESTGWLDRNGNAIVNARAKLRIWATDSRSGASEKVHHTKANDQAAPTFWQMSKRLELIEVEIKSILNRASQTATGYIIQPKDKEPLKRLRADRKELKAKLGLT